MKAQSELITKRLDGKIAVITGGNSGIGLATVQQFVDEGAYVFITGRRQNELDKAVKQIGKNVTGVQGDVSNLEDLDRLYATVKQQKEHQFWRGRSRYAFDKNNGKHPGMFTVPRSLG